MTDVIVKFWKTNWPTQQRGKVDSTLALVARAISGRSHAFVSQT
jgi:hypothetical protein